MFTAAHNHKENVRRLRKDARNTVDDAGDDITSMARAVGEQVREYVEKAMGSAGEGLSQAKETISDATNMVSKRMHRRPIESAAIALGIGLVLGAFLRRR